MQNNIVIFTYFLYSFTLTTNDDKKLNLKQCNLIKNGWPKNINRHIIKE
jgi:hypothetical protein